MMATPTLLDPARTQRAFTLVEVLASIMIMLLALAITFPTIGAMKRQSEADNGINTVSVAVKAVSAYSRLGRADLNPPDQTFKGIALIFSPSGEIRLTENDQLMVNGSGGILQPTRNGYRDIPNRDYIQIPRNAGIVGVIRGGSPAETRLVAPPFSIRFTENGALIAAQPSSTERVVYYDKEYNGSITVTSAGRPNNYDPAPYDPYSGSFVTSNFDTSVKKHKLPFEEIEAVVGVVVYSKSDLRASGLNLVGSASGGAVNDTARNWILENGKPVFFSRYAGTSVRTP